MSLFKRKDKGPQISAFDSIPQDVQDKVVEDIIMIVRTFKKWPSLMFPNEADREKASAEFQTTMRKVGIIAAQSMMSFDDEKGPLAIADALSKLPIPGALRPMLIAAFTTLVE